MKQKEHSKSFSRFISLIISLVIVLSACLSYPAEAKAFDNESSSIAPAPMLPMKSFMPAGINVSGLMSSLNKYYTSLVQTSDPVYLSMTRPSESRSDYMISVNRDYGKVFGLDNSDAAKKVLGFGAIYPTTGKKLPAKYTIYLSKIKTFAYSKSQKKWIVIDSHPYPTGIYIYTLPWTSTTVKKCKNISYTSNYAKVTLTADDLNSACLHFWGVPVEMKKNDYIYYACAYTFWTDSAAAGKVTAVNAIDSKDSGGNKTLKQFYSSRGYAASTSAKTVWGHTVPTSDYMKYNCTSLNFLY